MKKWFWDLRIGQKVLLLVITALTFLFVTGLVGVVIANNAEKTLNDISKNDHSGAIIIKNAMLDAHANRANVLMLIEERDKDEQAKIQGDIKHHGVAFLDALAKFKELKLDEKDKEQLIKIDETLNIYKADRVAIAKLVSEGRNAAAFQYFKDHQSSFENFTTAVTDLAADKEADAQKAFAQSIEAAKFAKVVILSTFLVAFAMILVFGLWMANMIGSRLTNLTNHVKRIAEENDLTSYVTVVAMDEIGILANTMTDWAKGLRETIQQIGKNAEDVSAGSEELSASSAQTAEGAQQVSISVQQLAAGANQVSISVEEGAKNLGHINTVIQGISDEAKVVAKLGDNTEENANVGKQSIEKAVDKIYNIRNVSAETSVTVSELGKLSEEIEQIVDLIKGIAGQTNLLALNAAIEAARAGEHGKGFAVVADEVKKLAGESANATDKITTMIKEIQNKTHLAVSSMDKGVQEVEQGVVIINEAGDALTEIINDVKSTNNKIQTITKEIDKVARDSVEVVKMIENIASVTEETSASAEEISSITEEQTASTEEIDASSQALAKIAETLQKQISIFKV